MRHAVIIPDDELKVTGSNHPLNRAFDELQNVNNGGSKNFSQDQVKSASKTGNYFDRLKKTLA